MTTLNYKGLILLYKNFDYGIVIKIDVSECKLKSLIELKLERFYKLEELYCQCNQLSNLDCISNCTSL